MSDAGWVRNATVGRRRWVQTGAAMTAALTGLAGRRAVVRTGRGGWLVAALAIALSGCGAEEVPPETGNASTYATATSGTAATPTATPAAGVDRLPVEGTPIGLAADAEDVWAVLATADAVESTAGVQVAVGGTPLRAIVTPHGLWVTVFGEGALALVDPTTATVLTRAELEPGDRDEPEGIAYAADSLWVVDQAADEVVQADATTGAIERRIAVGRGPRLVHGGELGVWVTGYADGTVTRVDPVDGTPTTSEKLCLGPQGVTEQAGLIWVACTISDEVVAVDPVTLEAVGRVGDLPLADAIVAAPDGSVLAVLQAGPTVVRIDAAAISESGATAIDEIAGVGTANLDAVIAGDKLWISSPATDELLAVALTDVGVG